MNYKQIIDVLYQRLENHILLAKSETLPVSIVLLEHSHAPVCMPHLDRVERFRQKSDEIHT